MYAAGQEETNRRMVGRAVRENVHQAGRCHIHFVPVVNGRTPEARRMSDGGDMQQ